jgi:hypothetical protein
MKKVMYLVSVVTILASHGVNADELGMLGAVLSGLGKGMEKAIQVSNDRESEALREQRLLQAQLQAKQAYAPQTSYNAVLTPSYAPVIQVYPDAFQILSSSQFQSWMNSKGVDFVNALNQSKSPRYVASVITDFKSETGYTRGVVAESGYYQPSNAEVDRQLRSDFDRIHQETVEARRESDRKEREERLIQIEQQRLDNEQLIAARLDNLRRR